MSYDVFISYSRVDKDVADKVRHVLEQNGLECWIDSKNIPAGSFYASKIIKAIREVKLVVLIFSETSKESRYVKSEINHAFEFEKEIISFNITDSEPEGDMEYFLKITQWLKAHPEPESGFDDLIEGALLICRDDSDPDIKWDLSDFVSDDMSGLKKDYLSLILLFTPFYWASFIYMGLVCDNDLWKAMGFIYIIPSIVCLTLYYQIWGVLFIFYTEFLLFLILFVVFWILAIIHGWLIRNEFLTIRAVYKVMPANNELFDALFEEYSKL